MPIPDEAFDEKLMENEGQHKKSGRTRVISFSFLGKIHLTFRPTFQRRALLATTSHLPVGKMLAFDSV
jgi:hypothetical protein